MNYELAKKLKEAGFPQDIDDYDGYFWSGKNKNDLIIIPSLSKLIKVCGDRFDSLFNASVRENIDWKASAWKDETSSSLEEEHGKTPAEAVANLWLKLNK